jgi:hypothetical protein
MKKITKEMMTKLIRWRLFAGIMMVVVLMMSSTALSQSSPAPVNLGTSGDFVILAKTGISTTGVTSVVGDMGVYPIDHTAITGFGLMLDPSGTYSTSVLVIGKIYAADYTDPTPAKMLAAIGDMEIAYTDAAGRTLPDYTELYNGDLTGQTLTHGLYKWGTGVMVSAGGVIISGTPDDVWIFQIAQDLTLANGAIITLQGGAQPANIFWQVAGQVTLGTSSQFKGVVLCQTLIAMETGGAFDGRALAQTAVTTDANSIKITGLVPVELTSFSAALDKNNVILSWSTATETNNRGFEIQRRNINQKEYERAGFVEGNGTSTEINSYSFTDKEVPAGNYGYRLKQTDYDGTFEYSDEVKVEITSPLEYSVSQNYPNPFNPVTTIRYAIPQLSLVKVSVYDILGEEIKVLVNEEQNPGNHAVNFDAKDFSSGVYFYKIISGEFSQVRKMILMK